MPTIEDLARELNAQASDIRAFAQLPTSMHDDEEVDADTAETIRAQWGSVRTPADDFAPSDPDSIA